LLAPTVSEANREGWPTISVEFKWDVSNWFGAPNGDRFLNDLHNGNFYLWALQLERKNGMTVPVLSFVSPSFPPKYLNFQSLDLQSQLGHSSLSCSTQPKEKMLQTILRMELKWLEYQFLACTLISTHSNEVPTETKVDSLVEAQSMHLLSPTESGYNLAPRRIRSKNALRFKPWTREGHPIPSESLEVLWASQVIQPQCGNSRLVEFPT